MPLGFRQRIYSSEMMDDMTSSEEVIEQALDELGVINSLLGGSRVSRKGIRTLSIAHNGAKELLVLDVGAGGSQFLGGLDKGLQIKCVAVDRHPAACRYINPGREKKNYEREVYPVNADAFSLPFRKKSFDIVHLSLFLHHFREDDIIRLLRQFAELSTTGIILNDLRRSLPAYLGIKLLTGIFSRSRMVKNDGPLSVKRAFVKKELTDIMKLCGFTSYTIKRYWAYRWLVCISTAERNEQMNEQMNEGTA